VTVAGRSERAGRGSSEGYSLSRSVGRAKFGSHGSERRKYMILR
jgi:hypothetical protein